MSVHKRTARSGTVTWVVRFRDPIPRERTFRLKGDAERFERRIIREMETGEYLDPSARKITFGQWHDRWWPTIESSDRAPSTIAGYESSLRIQVLPYLRDVPIKDLRKIHVQEWLGLLRKAGYSGSTIHIAKTAAGMVLTSAVDSGVIAGNPMAGLRIAKGTSKTRQALTAEQVELVADAVGPWWRPFVLVLAYCGLRPGEAIALRRRHLDDLGRLMIEGAVTEHRGRLIEGDTKTHRSRLVQVPESVLQELTAHMVDHVADRPDAPIFSATDGSKSDSPTGGTASGSRPSSRPGSRPVLRPMCSGTRRRASWPSRECPCRLRLPPSATIRPSICAPTPTSIRAISDRRPMPWTRCD